MFDREETNCVFERMYRAVELVKQRLDRTCIALRNANVPYAVIGGNAVAAWVATIDDGGGLGPSIFVVSASDSLGAATDHWEQRSRRLFAE